MSTETEIRRKGTKRIVCECYSPFQDERYGKQVRIYNRRGDDSWRCTICKKEVK